MKQSKSLLYVAGGLTVALVAGTIVVANNASPSKQEIQAKVFSNQIASGSKTTGEQPGVTREGRISLNDISPLEIDKNKPVQGTVTNIIPAPVEVKEEAFSNESLDEKLSRYWFKLRQVDKSVDDLNMVRSLLFSSLDGGKFPSIVGKFPLLLTETSSYGFNETFFPYPNGSVHLVTMVTPEVGKEDRIYVYITVNVGSNHYTKELTGLNVIPQDFAQTSGDSNAIIITGYDSNSGQPSFYAFSVSEDSISLLETDTNTQDKWNYIDHNGYYSIDSADAIDLEASTIDDDTLPTSINLYDGTSYYSLFIEDNQIKTKKEDE